MTTIEKLVIATIALILFGIGFGAYETVTVEYPKQYAVWVKTTGNPNHLSYDEWRSYERMEAAKRNQTVTVYAPLNR